MTEVAIWLLVRFEWLVLGYFVAVNGLQTVLLMAAGRELRRHAVTVWAEGRQRLLSSPVAPRVSVLAPAYNEATSVGHSVRALLTLSYPDLEVVLVNDGSTDPTLDVLREEFGLIAVHPALPDQVPSAAVRGLYRSDRHPGLVVLDKDNGGKADALNAGLNVATGALVCAVDADTLIESDALLRMVRPFLTDDRVVAAGGTVRVANGSVVRAGRVVHARAPRRPLAGAQAVEYLRAFLFGRLGWNPLGGNLIVSGAFGMFRRQAVLDVGGYAPGTVGEDMELVVRLRRRGVERAGPSRVAFVPDPVAWTEVPESLRTLGRQRERWHRGLADVLWRHRAMVGRPRYRGFGIVAAPYYVLVELLGPVVEALGLVGLAVALLLGAVDVEFAALFFLVAYGWGVVLSTTAVLYEQVAFRRYRAASDRLLLLAWSLLEHLGYRQLTVAWRLRGLYRYLKRRTDWGAMVRRGFDGAAASDEAVVPAGRPTDGDRGSRGR